MSARTDSPPPRLPQLSPLAVAERWLLAGLLAVAALGGTLRERSDDFFWHLVAGRWIVEQRALPDHDPFRFSGVVRHGGAGAPWVDHEWGFQVLLALGERLGGLGALTVARCVVLVGLVALLAHTMRRLGTPAAAVVAASLGAFLVVRGRAYLRPELASMLLLTVLLALLVGLRRRGGGWPVVAIPLLVVVWANLHPGALVAPGVVAAFLVGWWWSGGRSGAPTAVAPGPQPTLRLVVGLPLACALALLANPHGIEIALVPWRIGNALRGLPGRNPDWTPLWLAPRPGFLLLLAATGLLAVLAWRRRHRLDLALALVALLLLPLGSSAVRHLPLVAIALSLLAGSALAELHASGARWRLERVAPAALASAALVAAALWCVNPPETGLLRPRGAAPRFGVGIEPGLYPDTAAAVIADWPRLGPLYNDVAFGGYLLYRLYPPRQIFVDSRNELDPGLLHEIGAARADERRWLELLARYRIDGALVRYDERLRPTGPRQPGGAPSAHTSSALLFPRESFALVHWDDVAMLFVRRTPEREGELAAREYRFVQPEDWRATLRAAGADPTFRRGVAADLQRRLGEDPGCERARRLAEALLAEPGSP